jgi:glyoxylase-like metal-dependent hydrolase (beta-lactamase superfamily II)
VLGEEVRPGLWRWTAHHDEWKKEVASLAVEAASEVVLIDPLLAENQWQQLDAAVADRRLHVLLTIHWHARSAAEVAARFDGSRIWAHSRNRAAVARRAPVTDVFRIGEQLPAGLVALQARPRSEILLWEPRCRALIAGDALLGDGERGAGLHTCPASWLPGANKVEDLRRSLEPVLGLPVEIVLPSHGAPALIGAEEALRRVVSGAAGVDLSS